MSRRPVRMAGVDLVLALVGVLGVSASGPLMAGIGAPALAIAFWRNTLAVGVLVPVAAVTRRTELRGLTRHQLAATGLAGVMLAAHFATWVTSLKLTSVAAATALVCLQVAWVVLIGRLRGHVVTSAVPVGLTVSLLGVVVVSGVDVSLSTRALVGDMLALAGGLFAAVYTHIGSAVRQSLSTTAYTTLCYGTCALTLLVLCLLTGSSLWGYDAEAWLGLVAVTIAAQLLGHSVFNHLLAVMSPMLVSLVLLLEVPGAALLAAVFLGQVPPIGVYAGLVLILAGLVTVVVRGGAIVPAPVD